MYICMYVISNILMAGSTYIHTFKHTYIHACMHTHTGTTSGGQLFGTALDEWLKDDIKYTDGKINHWYQGSTEDLKKELHDKYVSLSICMYVFMCVCMYVYQVY